MHYKETFDHLASRLYGDASCNRSRSATYTVELPDGTTERVRLRANSGRSSDGLHVTCRWGFSTTVRSEAELISFLTAK